MAVALTAVAGLGASRLTTDYDPRAFHPKGTDLVRLTRVADASFGADDRLAVVAVLDERLFTRSGVARIDRLTRALAKERGVERVTSMTNVRRIVSDPGGIEVRAYGDPLPDTAVDVARLRADLLSDEAIAGGLVARDGGATALHVLVRESWTPPGRRADLHDRIAELLHRVRAEDGSAGVTLLLGGFPMVRVQYSREMLSQLALLLGTSALVLLLGLVILLRSVGAAALVLAVVAAANLWTHGAMGLAGQPLTILSMLTPIIVLVVGVADAIHILLAFRRAEGERTERMRQALEATVGPCLLTSLTTAVGFLALLTAVEVPMIGAYGLYTALGVVLAWVASVTMLPALICATRVEPGAPPAAAAAAAWVERRLAGALRSPRRILASWTVAAVLCAALASQVSTDATILDGLDPDHPIMRTHRTMEERFGGGLPLQVVYDAGGPDRLLQPDVIAHAAATADRLAGMPGVGAVRSPHVPVSRLRGALLGEQPSLPQTAPEVGEVFLAASLSDPDPLAPFVDEPAGILRIRSALPERGAHATIALQEDVAADLRARPLEGVTVGLAGTSYIAPRAWRILQERMAVGLLLAVLLITGLFGLLFRSPGLALVTLVPNLLPLLAVLAAMSLTGIAAKGNNAVVFSIAYGVAVDDTIHLLAQLRRHLSAGLPWRDALTAAHREVRGALTLTSLLLLAGFSVFLTSTFEFTVTLGLQMVVAVAVALAADLLLLPALLATLPGLSSRSRRSA